jgi:YD repeat-containing protein
MFNIRRKETTFAYDPEGKLIAVNRPPSDAAAPPDH